MSTPWGLLVFLSIISFTICIISFNSSSLLAKLRNFPFTVILFLFVFLFSLKALGLHASDKKIDTNPPIVEVGLGEDDHTSFPQILYNLGKDYLPSLVALLGILLALPLLRKKLIESHITSTLKNIQEANSESLSYNQGLIDKYLSLSMENGLLTDDDFKEYYKDIVEAHKVALKASSNVLTLLYFLKTTMEGVMYEKGQNPDVHIYKRNTSRLIMETLESVNFYATHAVPVPKSSKIRKQDLIVKSLRGYVSYSQVSQYKYFKIGLNTDPNSALYTMFYSKLNQTNSPILMKSAFKIFWSPYTIAKILFINNIYAPSIISGGTREHSLFQDERELVLIGFNNVNIHKGGGLPKKSVDLVYANPQMFFHFANKLEEEKLKLEFKDIWILESGFDLNKSTGLKHNNNEIITLSYSAGYLEDLLKSNKKRIKAKLKKSMSSRKGGRG